MQHGAPTAAIVQSFEGLSAYRGAYATYCKKKAHRKHRSRVNQDLKLIARQAMDEEDFEPAPIRSEQANSWDLW